MAEVPPTRMNLGVYKGKQIAAKKGYDLLKSKADALKVRFRDICKAIYDTKIGMADQSSAAFFSLTQAEYAAGNFRNKVLEGNMIASVRVTSRTDNVAGVKLPVFGQFDTGADSRENLGLVGGGRKITNCKEKFGDYLKALIKIASLQTSFIAMDEALKITNRRVNALENVTIPKIVGTIDYINRELDELEREDFTRLKMVKKKKEEAKKLEEKEMAKENLELAEAERTNKIAAAAYAAGPPPVPVTVITSKPAATTTAPPPAPAAPVPPSIPTEAPPVNPFADPASLPPSDLKPKKNKKNKKQKADSAGADTPNPIDTGIVAPTDEGDDDVAFKDL